MSIDTRDALSIDRNLVVTNLNTVLNERETAVVIRDEWSIQYGNNRELQIVWNNDPASEIIELLSLIFLIPSRANKFVLK